MKLLNPFDTKGSEDTSFVDRMAIAIIFLLVIFLTIAVPILLIGWYKKASNRSRILFWMVFCLMYVFGSIAAFCE